GRPERAHRSLQNRRRFRTAPTRLIAVPSRRTKTQNLSESFSERPTDSAEEAGFLGFEFRRVRSHRGRWMPLCTPQGKKRTALLRTLKQIFRSHRSRPVAEVIGRINPI